MVIPGATLILESKSMRKGNHNGRKVYMKSHMNFHTFCNKYHTYYLSNLTHFRSLKKSSEIAEV